jgi:hypothetical protein
MQRDDHTGIGHRTTKEGDMRCVLLVSILPNNVAGRRRLRRDFLGRGPCFTRSWISEQSKSIMKEACSCENVPSSEDGGRYFFVLSMLDPRYSRRFRHNKSKVTFFASTSHLTIVSTKEWIERIRFIDFLFCNENGTQVGFFSCSI